MKQILLPADSSSDLIWDLQIQEAHQASSILWEFDFKLDSFPFFIDQQAAFQSYLLAIETFQQNILPLFSNKTKGCILYQGTLDIVRMIANGVEEFSLPEAASFFGVFLQHLASYLPDDMDCYCLFEKGDSFTPSQRCQLLSQERFSHLYLSLTPLVTKRGLLLPSDKLWSSDHHQIIDQLLSIQPLKTIPELLLNEMWDGLDELIIFEDVITARGLWQIKGFEAAEGKVIRMNSLNFNINQYDSLINN